MTKEEHKRLMYLIEELRQRIDELAGEVNQIQDGQKTPSRLETLPSDGGFGLAELSNQYDLSRVIPPTPMEEADSIVGGLPTRDFEDCCAVGNDTGYYCTGTLIAPTLVVTAKHCKGITQVFLKGYDVNQPDTGETIRVQKQLEHPTADLSVLVLARPSTVQPRQVAKGLDIQDTMATLVGFGTINFEGDIGYGEKRKVEVPIVSLNCGSPEEVRIYGCRQGTEIVAGHRGLNRDSCRGDSGGPLYILGPDGGYYLLGATSRGMGGPRCCGDGGIYVRVDQYLGWISKKTGVQFEGSMF